MENNLNIIEYAFDKPETRAKKRIGPHPENIINFIFGILLGDSHAERRLYRSKNGDINGSTRITLQQEDSNIEYLMKCWKILSKRGYCSKKKPILRTKIVKKGKIRRIIRINTWSFTSFNYIHELFYIDGVKRVPKNIEEYLTPEVLAHWIMCDGSKVSSGIKLCTNSFIYEDLELLCRVLEKKYKLDSSIQKTGVNNQWIIYIKKNSMKKLNNLVKNYFVESMLRKLHINLDS